MKFNPILIFFLIHIINISFSRIVKKNRIKNELKSKENKDKSAVQSISNKNSENKKEDAQIKQDAKESKSEEENTKINEKDIPVYTPRTDATAKSEKPSIIQNPDWISSGYNIAYGNPLVSPRGSGLIDPGFTAPIFELLSNHNKTTYDNYYAFPDGFSVQETEVCQTQHSSRIISTSEELTSSMTASLGIGVAYGPVAFAVNSEYNSMKSSVESSLKSLISITASCSIYRIMVDMYNPPKFTQNFIEGLRHISKDDYSLSNDIIVKKYNSFFSHFGTHYLKEILMGSKYTYIEETSNESIDKNSNNQLSVSAKAEANFLASVKADSSFSKNNASANSSQKSASDIYVSSVGAIFPEDKNVKEWLSATKETPMPILYKIGSWVELLSFESVKKTLSDAGLNINKLSDNIKKANNDYCLILEKANNLKLNCEGKEETKLRDPIISNYIKVPQTNDLFKINCEKNSAINSLKFEIRPDSFEEIRTIHKCIYSKTITELCTNHETKQANVQTNFDLSWRIFSSMYDNGNISCENGNIISSIEQYVATPYVSWKYTCCKLKFNENTLETINNNKSRIGRIPKFENSPLFAGLSMKSWESQIVDAKDHKALNSIELKVTGPKKDSSNPGDFEIEYKTINLRPNSNGK